MTSTSMIDAAMAAAPGVVMLGAADKPLAQNLRCGDRRSFFRLLANFTDATVQ